MADETNFSRSPKSFVDLAYQADLPNLVDLPNLSNPFLLTLYYQNLPKTGVSRIKRCNLVGNINYFFRSCLIIMEICENNKESSTFQFEQKLDYQIGMKIFINIVSVDNENNSKPNCRVKGDSNHQLRYIFDHGHLEIREDA